MRASRSAAICRSMLATNSGDGPAAGGTRRKSLYGFGRAAVAGGGFGMALGGITSTSSAAGNSGACSMGTSSGEGGPSKRTRRSTRSSSPAWAAAGEGVSWPPSGSS